MIVSDVRMPGLDGPGLYRVLKNVEPEMTRRIIFVTGDTLSNDVEAFFRDNACPHLEKPIHPSDLVAIVKSVAASIPSAQI